MDRNEGKDLIFWENVNNYDKEIISVFKSKDNPLIKYLLSIKNKDKKTILDIGCGPGNSFEYIKEFKKIVALDFSKNMINCAKNNQHYSANKIELLIRNINQPLNLEEKFDYILCSMSLFPVNSSEFETQIENIKINCKEKSKVLIVVKSIESMLLSYHSLSELIYLETKSHSQVQNFIEDRINTTSFHPLGYLSTPRGLIQKNWLKEEMINTLLRHNFKIDKIDKIEYNLNTYNYFWLWFFILEYPLANSGP